MKPTISVLLLNYYKWQDTVDCIESLRKCTYPNYNVVIVENASPNESEKMLRDYLPDMKIYQTGKNLGYTGGINYGIRKALEENPEFILVLNQSGHLCRSEIFRPYCGGNGIKPKRRGMLWDNPLLSGGRKNMVRGRQNDPLARFSCP